ncbi:hypothetical protein [Streptomyces sp. NPDC046261]|uniref:hypothetical protein n=1 Tax=Streptomyces sp. NPDC046261 TaxID=3157200 RepID=UPI0033FFFE25
MLGDRLANEFWYRFDEATLVRQSPELKEAYAAITRHVGGNPSSGMLKAWTRLGMAEGYPASYAEFLRPVREPLRIVSGVQLAVFERYYRHRPHGVFTAFSLFAQGVLFDPRREPVQAEVHTMDGDPPLGYHVWHAYQRASVLLGIDGRFWTSVIPVNGFAWALQLLARPDTRKVNPALPRETVRRVAASWLVRSPDEVDRALLEFHRPGK